MNFEADRKFDSLRSAFRAIMGEFAVSAPVVNWKTTESGLVVPAKAPRFIFRGECGNFPTTLSTARRPQTYELKSDGERLAFNESLQRELMSLTSALVSRLQQPQFGLNRVEALAYLQHYQFPTTIIDFTGDLGVAFSFAAGKVTPIARIAVLPYKQATDVKVVDLYDHPWAERAQRQGAFGLLIPPRVTDLKTTATRHRLGIKWFEFPVETSDASKLVSRLDELLRLRDDPSAGFLPFLITEYVEAKGPLSAILTDWLLQFILMSPRCMLVKGFETSEAVVNFRGNEVLPRFNDEVEKQMLRSYWTGQVSSWERMKNWKWPTAGSIAVDPRTYHPDAYPPVDRTGGILAQQQMRQQ